MITGTLLPALPVMIGEGECTVSFFMVVLDVRNGNYTALLHFSASVFLCLGSCTRRCCICISFPLGVFFFGVHVGDVVIGVVG